MVLFKSIKPRTPEEIEIRFLRMLVARLADGGTYLSGYDMQAIMHLKQAHSQDKSDVNTAIYAIGEYVELNPNYTGHLV